MKLITVTVIAMAGTTMLAKNLPVAASAPEVTVCMEASANFAINQAQGEASKIFEQVPVRILWRSGRVCNQHEVIHIRLREQTPATLKPRALAYAVPYEGTYIELFYDRIRTTVPSSVLPHLLANVLVHEITHILQGEARHSESGVMKAHWTPVDYREMRIHPLPFTIEDIRMIQDGLKSRGERVEASTGASAPGESR